MTALVLILISAVLWGLFLLWLGHVNDAQKFNVGSQDKVEQPPWVSRG